MAVCVIAPGHGPIAPVRVSIFYVCPPPVVTPIPGSTTCDIECLLEHITDKTADHSHEFFNVKLSPSLVCMIGVEHKILDVKKLHIQVNKFLHLIFDSWQYLSFVCLNRWA